MKILLATDGSESARAAVDCLLRFPFPRNSEVTLLSVIDRNVFKNEEVSNLNEEQRHELAETEKIVQLAAQDMDGIRAEHANSSNRAFAVSSPVRTGPSSAATSTGPILGSCGGCPAR